MKDDLNSTAGQTTILSEKAIEALQNLLRELENERDRAAAAHDQERYNDLRERMMGVTQAIVVLQTLRDIERKEG